VNGRFLDNGELKYSLRSLEKHFPSHRKVFVVTDQQAPTWLSDAAILIDHQKIMEPPLPTFSSKRIEANLSKIPVLVHAGFILTMTFSWDPLLTLGTISISMGVWVFPFLNKTLNLF
jgi:hypothetical protein